MLIHRVGLAAAALAAAACFVTPASAADLYNYRGSIKDGPMPVRPARNCYFRADTGYSWTQSPDVRWTVTDADNTSPTFGQFLTDRVTNVAIDDTWMVEAGVGCGSGPRGLRGEFVYGFHGKRDISGEPGPWNPGTPPTADPLHTAVTTHTLMFNGYYDLGNYAGLVPYVGAGVGLAYNKVDEVYFTGNPFLVNRIAGDDRWGLAWSLMAGVGYQISDRITLDIGYRYLDMGKAESGHVDSAGFWNPKVRIDDLAAHEIKVGLRFAFGGGDPILSMK